MWLSGYSASTWLSKSTGPHWEVNNVEDAASWWARNHTDGVASNASCCVCVRTVLLSSIVHVFLHRQDHSTTGEPRDCDSTVYISHDDDDDDDDDGDVMVMWWWCDGDGDGDGDDDDDDHSGDSDECAGLCDTMFTVSSTLMWAVLTGPTNWVCHIETLTLCVKAVA